MKKNLVTIVTILIAMLLLIASFIGCSGLHSNVPTYPEVTIQNFTDNCESPDEVHNVPAFQFPIPAQVIRQKGCMGVDDLLVVAWPGDLNEKNLTAVKLLTLMYVEHQGGLLQATLLRTDTKTIEDEMVVNMAFYKLEKIQEEVKQ